MTNTDTSQRWALRHSVGPQYFGVLPGFRRLGLGRLLWRAAMDWGAAHGAAYQILNTVVDGASDHLCRDEGLTDLGIICATATKDT